jgi:hypothetical protein
LGIGGLTVDNPYKPGDGILAGWTALPLGQGTANTAPEHGITFNVLAAGIDGELKAVFYSGNDKLDADTLTQAMDLISATLAAEDDRSAVRLDPLKKAPVRRDPAVRWAQVPAASRKPVYRLGPGATKDPYYGRGKGSFELAIIVPENIHEDSRITGVKPNGTLDWAPPIDGKGNTLTLDSKNTTASEALNETFGKTLDALDKNAIASLTDAVIEVLPHEQLVRIVGKMTKRQLDWLSEGQVAGILAKLSAYVSALSPAAKRTYIEHLPKKVLETINASQLVSIIEHLTLEQRAVLPATAVNGAVLAKILEISRNTPDADATSPDAATKGAVDGYRLDFLAGLFAELLEGTPTTVAPTTPSQTPTPASSASPGAFDRVALIRDAASTVHLRPPSNPMPTTRTTNAGGAPKKGEVSFDLLQPQNRLARTPLPAGTDATVKLERSALERVILQLFSEKAADIQRIEEGMEKVIETKERLREQKIAAAQEKYAKAEEAVQTAIKENAAKAKLDLLGHARQNAQNTLDAATREKLAVDRNVFGRLFALLDSAEFTEVIVDGSRYHSIPPRYVAFALSIKENLDALLRTEQTKIQLSKIIVYYNNQGAQVKRAFFSNLKADAVGRLGNEGLLAKVERVREIFTPQQVVYVKLGATHLAEDAHTQNVTYQPCYPDSVLPDYIELILSLYAEKVTTNKQSTLTRVSDAIAAEYTGSALLKLLSPATTQKGVGSASCSVVAHILYTTDNSSSSGSSSSPTPQQKDTVIPLGTVTLTPAYLKVVAGAYENAKASNSTNAGTNHNRLLARVFNVSGSSSSSSSSSSTSKNVPVVSYQFLSSDGSDNIYGFSTKGAPAQQNLYEDFAKNTCGIVGDDLSLFLRAQCGQIATVTTAFPKPTLLSTKYFSRPSHGVFLGGDGKEIENGALKTILGKTHELLTWSKENKGPNDDTQAVSVVITVEVDNYSEKQQSFTNAIDQQRQNIKKAKEKIADMPSFAETFIATGYIPVAAANGTLCVCSKEGGPDRAIKIRDLSQRSLKYLTEIQLSGTKKIPTTDKNARLEAQYLLDPWKRLNAQIKQQDLYYNSHAANKVASMQCPPSLDVMKLMPDVKFNIIPGTTTTLPLVLDDNMQFIDPVTREMVVNDPRKQYYTILSKYEADIVDNYGKNNDLPTASFWDTNNKKKLNYTTDVETLDAKTRIPTITAGNFELNNVPISLRSLREIYLKLQTPDAMAAFLERYGAAWNYESINQMQYLIQQNGNVGHKVEEIAQFWSQDIQTYFCNIAKVTILSSSSTNNPNADHIISLATLREHEADIVKKFGYPHGLKTINKPSSTSSSPSPSPSPASAKRFTLGSTISPSGNNSPSPQKQTTEVTIISSEDEKLFSPEAHEISAMMNDKAVFAIKNAINPDNTEVKKLTNQLFNTIKDIDSKEDSLLQIHNILSHFKSIFVQPKYLSNLDLSPTSYLTSYNDMYRNSRETLVFKDYFSFVEKKDKQGTPVIHANQPDKTAIERELRALNTHLTARVAAHSVRPGDTILMMMFLADLALCGKTGGGDVIYCNDDGAPQPYGFTQDIKDMFKLLLLARNAK